MYIYVTYICTYMYICSLQIDVYMYSTYTCMYTCKYVLGESLSSRADLPCKATGGVLDFLGSTLHVQVTF